MQLTSCCFTAWCLSLCYRETIDIMPYQFCGKCRDCSTVTLITVSTIPLFFIPWSRFLKTAHLFWANKLCTSFLSPEISEITNDFDWSFKQILPDCQVIFFHEILQSPSGLLSLETCTKNIQIYLQLNLPLSLVRIERITNKQMNQ